MQLAKTQNTQGKIDTGSGCWGCWGTVAVDINDLICICICTHVCICLYIRSNPTAVARLRPKLRKSSQHCHFSACFSFFFFFLWKFIKKQLWICWGPSPRANLTRSQAQQQHKQRQDPRDERRDKGCRGEGGNAHSYRGVCQSDRDSVLTSCHFACLFSVIHPFINTQRRQLLFLLRDFLVYLWIAVNLIPPIRWLYNNNNSNNNNHNKGNN